ncbi:hypothetical protein LBW90_00815 [Pantoea rwandensis]|uniref:hypothetical protein n=1 Tax=Pantoea sp. alder69 TaxID=2913093 RepID=UPI001CD374D7|nr:hypothetical protein [Pantoea sp. alder69]MCA1176105.1 hypothetical protein [Pantoea sp. alder69]MCA1249076.1 hypothetical protein [Pantoea sp. alder70]
MKTLPQGKRQTPLEIANVMAIVLALFSRYAQRFAISIAHAVTRYPVLTEQARHLLGSKGDSPRSNLETVTNT